MKNKLKKAIWRPFAQQQQEAGELRIGTWSEQVWDDFTGGAAGVGDLGWTPAQTGTGATITTASAVASTARLASVNGGAVMFLGTGAASICAVELLGCTLYPNTTTAALTNNLYLVNLDFRIVIDTALSNPTNTYRLMAGMFDSAGAVSTGNFIGLEYTGTAGVGQNWRFAYGTAAAPTYVDTGIGVSALDIPMNLRIQIGAGPINPAGAIGWAYMTCEVNSVAPVPTQTALMAAMNPGGAVYPAIVAGWPGVKALTTVGTTASAKIILDAAAVAVSGRQTN